MSRRGISCGVAQVMAELDGLIGAGRNVFFAHTMAGGIPKANNPYSERNVERFARINFLDLHLTPFEKHAWTFPASSNPKDDELNMVGSRVLCDDMVCFLFSDDVCKDHRDEMTAMYDAIVDGEGKSSFREMEAVLERPYILMTDLKIRTPEVLATARAIAEEDGRPLLVIAEEMAPDVVLSLLQPCAAAREALAATTVA